MVKFILGLIFIAMLASAIMSKISGDPPTAEKRSSSPPAEVEIVTGPARAEIVSRVTKGLSLERDKIEKVSFYSAKSRTYLASRVEPYISLSDNMLPLLRMKATYFGDDWVFYDSIKIMVDDQVIYERGFRHSDVARNNSSGSVWETADYPANEDELRALAAIAKSKSATIRFSGDKRRRDHEITKKERQQIKQVLEAYAQLAEQLTSKSTKGRDDAAPHSSSI